jgi:hypothetical protein
VADDEGSLSQSVFVDLGAEGEPDARGSDDHRMSRCDISRRAVPFHHWGVQSDHVGAEVVRDLLGQGIVIRRQQARVQNAPQLAHPGEVKVVKDPIIDARPVMHRHSRSSRKAYEPWRYYSEPKPASSPRR